MQEQQAAASIQCDLCPLMLKYIWSEMGITAKKRDSRSHHFVMSILEDVCGEGSDDPPPLFEGHTIESVGDGRFKVVPEVDGESQTDPSDSKVSSCVLVATMTRVPLFPCPIGVVRCLGYSLSDCATSLH